MKRLSRPDALAILTRIVTKAEAHRDYKRTVEYADLSRKIVTAVDASSLLIQFVRREEKVLFDQRVAVTQHIFPAVSGRVMAHFYRVGRLDTVQKRIGFEDRIADRERRIQEIQDRVDTYAGDDSVDDYLAQRLVDLNFIDPNTFILTDFQAFDNRIEKAEPYPVEIPSLHAYNYSLLNNRLDWLVTRYEIPVVKADKTTYKGFEYTMYCADEIYRFTRVDEFAPDLAPDFRLSVGETEKYALSIANPKGGEVQAYRVGYKKDLTTESRTCVSPMDSAYCYFMDMVHTVSNFHLARLLHAFPQKLQYVGECSGPVSSDMKCRDGKLDDNSTCPVCKGSGVENIHTSPQDALLIKKPRDPEDMLDLEKLLVYKTPPIEVLKFQDEQVDKLEAKVLTTIFNAENLVQTTVSKTATEVQLSAESRFNTLFPFSKCFSRAWLKTVRLIAAFTDNSEGLQLMYAFPNDFKLKTEGELLSDLEAANKAEAPAVLRQRIALNIAEKKLADDEIALLRYRTQVAFTPFQGKTTDEIKFILTNGFCTEEDRILWTHSDSIFDELEWEQPAFFRMPRKAQVSIVAAKVKKIAGNLPSTAAVLLSDTEAPTEGGTTSGAGNILRETVGGGELVIRLQESVAKGITEYEAGVAMLRLMFDFSEAEARELLGDPIDLTTQTEEATVVV